MIEAEDVRSVSSKALKLARGAIGWLTGCPLSFWGQSLESRHPMSLSAGARGPYEILALLGVGGMGEV